MKVTYFSKTVCRSPIPCGPYEGVTLSVILLVAYNKVIHTYQLLYLKQCFIREVRNPGDHIFSIKMPTLINFSILVKAEQWYVSLQAFQKCFSAANCFTILLNKRFRRILSKLFNLTEVFLLAHRRHEGGEKGMLV